MRAGVLLVQNKPDLASVDFIVRALQSTLKQRKTSRDLSAVFPKDTTTLSQFLCGRIDSTLQNAITSLLITLLSPKNPPPHPTSQIPFYGPYRSALESHDSGTHTRTLSTLHTDPNIHTVVEQSLIHILRGCSEFNLENWTMALIEFRAAVTKDPESKFMPQLIYNICVTYYQLNEDLTILMDQLLKVHLPPPPPSALSSSSQIKSLPFAPYRPPQQLHRPSQHRKSPLKGSLSS